MQVTLEQCEQVVADMVAAGTPHFKKYTKDGYVVFDYILSGPETFKSSVAKEMRGIAFDLEGNLISRPYHKFHNLNENIDYTADKFDFADPHVVLEKLDGSMLRSINVPGRGVVLGTRAGETEVSALASKYITQGVNALLKWVAYENLTAIFEFVGPDNQIVLNYNESKLILTAIRENETGEYFTYERMVRLAAAFGIPVVNTVAVPTQGLTQVSEWVRGLKGTEGIVIRFEDGRMIKVKADEYVAQHRALNNLMFEKDVLKMFLENTLDDVKGLLQPERLALVNKYVVEVQQDISSVATVIESIFATIRQLPRREFAEQAMQTPFSGVLFKMFDNKNVVGELIAGLLKSCSSGPKLQEYKKRMGMTAKFELKFLNTDQ